MPPGAARTSAKEPAERVPWEHAAPVITAPHRRMFALLLVSAVFLVLLEALGLHTLKHPEVVTDFRQAYGAGRMVLTEPHALYNLDRQKQVQDATISPQDIPLPFVHPAYEALLYAPFAVLPYRAAYLAFIAFNVVLLVLLFLATRGLFERPASVPPVPGLVFFLYVPALVAIWQGQDSVLFLCLCAAVWLQLERGRDALAGFLLALCLFRFQLALPVAALLMVRRGRRFAGGFTLTATAVAALSVALTGWSGTRDFVHLLQGVSLSGDQSSKAQFVFAMHPFAMPNLFGLLFACGAGRMNAHAAMLLTLAVYLAVLAFAALRMRRVSSAAAMAMAVMGAFLVSHHLYLHDATLLLLPLALIGNRRPVLIGATVFYLPIVLFFFVGTKSLFLLAVPALALLWLAARPGSPEESVHAA